jgi:aryl-alcohol dehydrogenase-like predicted oxidoreductase
VVPIIGCRTFAQLEECIAAVPVRLTPAELAALEKVSKSGLPAA